MAGELRLEVLGAQGPVDLGVLSGDEIVIGREPGQGSSGGGIAINAVSISRQHGAFARHRGCWVYRDLGSTNGSWLNGVAVPEGMGRIVRPGDALQMADVAVKILSANPGESSDSTATPMMRSALVFQRGQFLEEYPIPQYGRALAIGGARADLPLDAEVEELPALVLEGRGSAVVGFALAPQRAFSVNDKAYEANQTVTLADRDTLTIGAYVVMVNDPTSGLTPMGGKQAPQMRDWTAGNRASERDGNGDTTQRLSSGRTVTKIPFGQSAPLEESYDDPTIQVDYNNDEISRYGGRASRRNQSGLDESGVGAGEGVEEKVILFIGVALLVAVLILIGWWAFL
jgi:pSer/pThr/pTyr-binding forkhead associated (FHA) protein